MVSASSNKSAAIAFWSSSFSGQQEDSFQESVSGIDPGLRKFGLFVWDLRGFVVGGVPSATRIRRTIDYAHRYFVAAPLLGGLSNIAGSFD